VLFGDYLGASGTAVVNLDSAEAGYLVPRARQVVPHTLWLLLLHHPPYLITPKESAFPHTLLVRAYTHHVSLSFMRCFAKVLTLL